MNSSEVSLNFSKLSCQWKYRTWHTGTEIAPVPSSVSTHCGVSSAKMSISLTGCGGNRNLELVKFLHVVKYLNEKWDVRGSACWWLFSWLGVVLCFLHGRWWFLVGEIQAKILSLYSHIHHQGYFHLVVKKKKEPKREKKTFPFCLPASLLDLFSLLVFSISPALFKYLLYFINT